MNHDPLKTITTAEYTPATFPAHSIPMHIGEYLWTHHSAQVHVEFPSLRTQGQWKLTPSGWVGLIPLPDDFELIIEPKVPISNLFRMLEYTPHLQSFQFFDTLTATDTLPETYERLARILAVRILDRTRKGLYQTYRPKSLHTSAIQGRLDLNDLMQRPWTTRPLCHTHTNSTDIPDNQILFAALHVITRSAPCTQETLSVVRRAIRALQGAVSIVPITHRDCIGRTYNRLNRDYETLHALCRFFLEHTGPHHTLGAHRSLAFLVNMNQLFERFIARWLNAKLPTHLNLQAQHRVDLDQPLGLHFDVDLVLQDQRTGQPYAVIDTKYKKDLIPSTKDIAQVVAYAESLSAPLAALLYPTPAPNPLNTQVGSIRTVRLTYDLSTDLESEGQRLLQTIVDHVQHIRRA